MSTTTTPQVFIPSTSPDFTMAQLCGTVISAIAYGIVLSLSAKSLWLLVKTKHIYAKTMRVLLLMYVFAMLGLSTASMVEEFTYMEILMFRPLEFLEAGTDSDLNNGKLLFINDISYTIPLAIWGADGFMMWRCFFLYQNVSKLGRLLLTVLLAIVSVISLGAGVLFYCPYDIATLSPNLLVSQGFLSWLSLYQGLGVIAFSMTVTPCVNTFLAGLIVGRLIYHQHYIVNTLGYGHDKPYNRIIMMCVESCALITLGSLLYIGFAFSFSTLSLSHYAIANGYFLLSFPHICVISPLILIVRVAQGRAATTRAPDSEITPLQFQQIDNSTNFVRNG